MSMHNDEQPQEAQSPGRYASTGGFPPSRRKLATGAVGLAVLLGGGAYLMTAQLQHQNNSTVGEGPPVLSPVLPVASAQQPAVGPTSSAPASGVAATSPPTTSLTATTSPAVTHTPKPVPTKTDSAAIRKKIDAARAAAARDGHPLQRALTAGADSVDPGPISTTTQKTAEGSIRITSAKGDLTGHDPQLLAADEGTPAGDGHCTNKLRFSKDAAAKVMPTVLLCWRTSAERSVITLATAKNGKPSTATSIAVINREWAKLG